MGILGWALTFFIIALLAAVFGFTGIAAASAWIAQLLFFIFLAVFIILLIAGLVGRSRHSPPAH